MAIKYLLWGRSRVVYCPVIDGGLCDEANGGIRDPFPEDNILAVHVRLDLGLCLDIENL